MVLGSLCGKQEDMYAFWGDMGTILVAICLSCISILLRSTGGRQYPGSCPDQGTWAGYKHPQIEFVMFLMSFFSSQR